MMKKKFLKVVLACAFIFAIVINLSVNQKSQEQDVSLLIKNIEALADGEYGNDHYGECIDCISPPLVMMHCWFQPDHLCVEFGCTYGSCD